MTAKAKRAESTAKKPATKRAKRVAKRKTAPVQKQRKNNVARRKGGCTGKGFMPGESGNPGGRPKGPSFRKIARDMLDAEAEADLRDALRPKVGKLVDKFTRMELIAFLTIRRAIKGDKHAIDTLLDRLDPKSIVEAPPVDVKVSVGVREWPPGADGGTDADRQ